MRALLVVLFSLVFVLVAVTPAVAQVETHRLTLDAQSRQVDCGLDLASGDFVYVRASGSWSCSPETEPCDANGTDATKKYMDERHLTSALPVADAKNMTLIGKVGAGGKWFKMGSRWETLVNQTGRLYLAANDLVFDNGDAYDDNGGVLDIEITITKIGGAVPPGPNGLYPVVARVVSTHDGLGVEAVKCYVLGPFGGGGIPAICQTNAAGLARSAESKVKEGDNLAVAGSRENSISLSAQTVAAKPVVFDGISMAGIIRSDRQLPAQMYQPSWRGMFITSEDGIGRISLLPGVYAVYLVGPDKSVTMVSGVVARGQINGWNFKAAIKVDRKEIEAKSIYEYAWYDVDKGVVWFWAEAAVSGPVERFNMINRVWSRSDSFVDVPLSSAKKGWNPFSVRLEDLGLDPERHLLYADKWIPLRAGAYFDSDGKVKEVNEDNNMVIRDANGPGIKMWWDHQKLWDKVNSGGFAAYDDYE